MVVVGFASACRFAFVGSAPLDALAPASPALRHNTTVAAMYDISRFIGITPSFHQQLKLGMQATLHRFWNGRARRLVKDPR
jgi:hypothetical protein